MPTRASFIQKASGSEFQLPRSQTKAFTYQCMPCPQTVTSFEYVKRKGSQDKIMEQRQSANGKVKKSIFMCSREKERKIGTQVESWGNRIRNELMGTNRSKDKTRKEASSRTSLMNCKESIIIGEKIDRNNLKINESFSNISENQSSKRYYDEDFEFLPQIKKISYNNIDVSRD